MLDVQYTLEKLAEYRELGHDGHGGHIDDPLIGARRLRTLRLSFLSLLASFFVR